MDYSEISLAKKARESRANLVLHWPREVFSSIHKYSILGC